MVVLLLEAGYNPTYKAGKSEYGGIWMWVAIDADTRLASTSSAKRQNLTMRMKMRRFTRLTNAFSKDPISACPLGRDNARSGGCAGPGDTPNNGRDDFGLYR